MFEVFNKKLVMAGAVAMSLLMASSVAVADDDWNDDDRRPRSQQVRKNSPPAQQGQLISRQKAGQIARSRVKNSRVKSIDFDRNDDGYGAVYDVELVSGRVQYDVKINAHTGKVIYVKRDD